MKIDQEMTGLLSKLTSENPLPAEDNQKLHSLVGRNIKLNEALRSVKPPRKNFDSTNQNSVIDEKITYCSNCGAPNSGNVYDGTLWCFKCNKPFIGTTKKPMPKWTPTMKGFSKDEFEEFQLKQNEIFAPKN